MMSVFVRFVLLLGFLAILPATYAEESLLDNDATDIEVPERINGPRATMQTFITAMSTDVSGGREQINLAISTLDLSYLPTVIQQQKGEMLITMLLSVIERSKDVVLSEIPLEPKDNKYVFGRYSQGDVSIVKQDDGQWLFSQVSLRALPDILEGLIEAPAKNGTKDPKVALPFYIHLRTKLPDFLKQGFLLEYWQWLGILFVVIIGFVVDKLVAWFLFNNVRRWKIGHTTYEGMDDSTLRPLGLMAMALIWWFLLGLLGLPATALVILSVAVKLLVSISAVWSAFRLVDIVYVLLMRKALKTNNRFDDLLVPMISKSLKVFVVVMGVVFSADNLNIDVTSLLAGLGLGGLAFALAAKDLLGNFFGSLTVLLDRPFQIGDWVVIGDVEGSVEEVGFRSTRIRTFYNSLITLPNAILTNTKIDNMGARRYRRMKSMLGLTYDTPPEKIDAFCEGIRVLIRLHPYMRKDYYHVYFNQYNAASLDILVYVFWETPDWNMELRERHRFLLDILRLAKQIGVEFAYPTQTLYLKQELASSGKVAGEFNTTMSEAEAFEIGRREAQSIVEATVGLDAKPGPVKFP
jgi:MscS family membrane protein